FVVGRQLREFIQNCKHAERLRYFYMKANRIIKQRILLREGLSNNGYFYVKANRIIKQRILLREGKQDYQTTDTST
ncbi:hypothetical protein CHS0354_031446, partial [Potamilus streckersoni]